MVAFSRAVHSLVGDFQTGTSIFLNIGISIKLEMHTTLYNYYNVLNSFEFNKTSNLRSGSWDCQSLWFRFHITNYIHRPHIYVQQYFPENVAIINNTF